MNVSTPDEASIAVNDKSEREPLERRANLLRNRFLQRLDTLDRRGHELVETATELREQTKRALPYALGIAGAAAVVGAVIYFTGRRRRRPQAILERLLGEAPRVDSPLRVALKTAARSLIVKGLQAAAQHAIDRMTEASNAPAPELGAHS